MDKKKILSILLSFAPSLLILLIQPLGMDLRQSGIFAILVLVILWWATQIVPRSIGAVLLLGVLLLFSGATPQDIFAFPLSENFILIIVSFLFSHGIAVSGLTDKYLSPFISKYATTAFRLVLIMIFSVGLMIFIIPQPMSRIIILASIYSTYFSKLDLPTQLRQTLMVGLFLFIIFVNLFLIRADLVLTPTYLAVAGLSLTESQWFTYLSVPALVHLVLVVALYLFIFRNTLKEYRPTPLNSQAKTATPATKEEKRWLVLIIVAVVAWALEDIHGINGTLIVVVATLLMFPLKLLRPMDVREINFSLLLFVTATFAIGSGLRSSGVADIIFAQFLPLFPTTFNITYALLVLLSAMALHLVLGSNLTATSVVVPGLMSLGAGIAPTTPLVLIMYVGICSHVILPFHNVILIIGEGMGEINTKTLLRMTLPLTILHIPMVLFVYLGWWQFLGLA